MVHSPFPEPSVYGGQMEWIYWFYYLLLSKLTVMKRTSGLRELKDHTNTANTWQQENRAASFPAPRTGSSSATFEGKTVANQSGQEVGQNYGD